MDCTELLQTYVSQQIGKKPHLVMYDYAEFVRLGFGSREGNEGDMCSSGRSCYKLSPCPVLPLSADSNMESPLAKVKAMSDCGTTSGITHLRRGMFK